MLETPLANRTVVVGRGPAGLTAAIALARAGIKTALVGRPAAKPDNRTTALLAASVDVLERLGVWEQCAAQAAPLEAIRIVDDTGRLWRAPEVTFEAHEIGRDAFGYNIENVRLIETLERSARSLSALEIIEDEANEVAPGADNVRATLQNGQVADAPLAIAADGRRSLCRERAGISVEMHAYPQIALTLCFSHSRPHRNCSTEFHTASGPFTVVPLPGDRSSLVWVTDPAAADRIAALDDEALAEELESRMHSILGKVTVESGRGTFPLHLGRARRFAANRVALIGEAAHVLPPIGAQGLNLGLRDAAAIAQIAAGALRRGQDMGGFNVMARYDKERRVEIGSRTLAVDMLNRTLLSDFLPLQGARALGLYLLDRIGPLRRAVMRQGIAPTATRTERAGI